MAAGAEEWKRILAAHSFRDPAHCLRLVQEFVHGPGFGHRSSRTVDHALQLLGRMLSMCPQPNAAAPAQPFLSDPDRVLRNEGDGLHSRKLRSFDEPPLR